MKAKKSLLLPILLLLYLGAIAYFNFPEYVEKQNHFEFWGSITATIGVIVGLRYVLLLREKKERYKRDKQNSGNRKTW